MKKSVYKGKLKNKPLYTWKHEQLIIIIRSNKIFHRLPSPRIQGGLISSLPVCVS